MVAQFNPSKPHRSKCGTAPSAICQVPKPPSRISPNRQTVFLPYLGLLQPHKPKPANRISRIRPNRGLAEYLLGGERRVEITTMTTPAKEQLGQAEKVRILLHEYATLRAEILARIGHMYPLGAASAALFFWLLARPFNFWLWLAFIASLIVVTYFYWLISRDIKKAARRLRELEHDINERAGETLLIWETKWGGTVTGWMGRGEPKESESKDESTSA